MCGHSSGSWIPNQLPVVAVALAPAPTVTVNEPGFALVAETEDGVAAHVIPAGAPAQVIVAWI